MIKKRTRPQPRLDLNDLIELRKLRKARQGIDAAKLNKGDARKKKKRPREEEEAEQGGLRKGAAIPEDEEMAYIEENLKVRGKPRDEDEKKGPADPQEALYQIADRWKVEKQKPTPDDGSVTNSMSMLTAIPEVDLGMDTRLKNIEETEKAKRVRKKVNNDEEHLVASRCAFPILSLVPVQTPANHLRSLPPEPENQIGRRHPRDAKLEAMGMPVQDDQPRRTNEAARKWRRMNL
ncbi:hepatocellular carcinoma-associated antigen 59-domain-containing protein [Mycena olivaceomarginata]|nr:hepatocellular carcinoma-associated antigen 59-domain-containing protein [Mycena olivaceomarginata]